MKPFMFGDTMLYLYSLKLMGGLMRCTLIQASGVRLRRRRSEKQAMFSPGENSFTRRSFSPLDRP